MSKELKPLKSFAPITEREQIREHFTQRARDAPAVNPLDPGTMESWWDYVDEMREIEQQLRETGDIF